MRSLINPGIPETIATTQTTNTETTTAQTNSGNSTSASQSVSEFVPPPAVPNFPVILVANLSDLQVGVPINFNYPLEETPNILVKSAFRGKAELARKVTLLHSAKYVNTWAVSTGLWRAVQHQFAIAVTKPPDQSDTAAATVAYTTLQMRRK